MIENCYLTPLKFSHEKDQPKNQHFDVPPFPTNFPLKIFSKHRSNFFLFAFQKLKNQRLYIFQNFNLHSKKSIQF